MGKPEEGKDKIPRTSWGKVPAIWLKTMLHQQSLLTTHSNVGRRKKISMKWEVPKPGTCLCRREEVSVFAIKRYVPDQLSKCMLHLRVWSRCGKPNARPKVAIAANACAGRMHSTWGVENGSRLAYATYQIPSSSPLPSPIPARPSQISPLQGNFVTSARGFPVFHVHI